MSTNDIKNIYRLSSPLAFERGILNESVSKFKKVRRPALDVLLPILVSPKRVNSNEILPPLNL